MTFNESCGPVKCLIHVASIYLNQQLLSIELPLFGSGDLSELPAFIELLQTMVSC